MSRRHSYHFTGAVQSPGDRPSSDGSTKGHSQDQLKHKAEDKTAHLQATSEGGGGYGDIQPHKGWGIKQVL